MSAEVGALLTQVMINIDHQLDRDLESHRREASMCTHEGVSRLG